MDYQSRNTRCSQSEADSVPSLRVSNNRGHTCMCSSIVLGFLAFLFAATLGIILGAYFSATLLASITAVIAEAVILAILIIALLIYKACINCKFGC